MVLDALEANHTVRRGHLRRTLAKAVIASDGSKDPSKIFDKITRQIPPKKYVEDQVDDALS
ncbi:hypothetical protein BSP239C_03711 [Brevibacterium sp. 239c]|nr:hypothetical protein BSP239C_03711 [Brevibacterium sp. 239c]